MSAHQQALYLTPGSHPSRPSILTNLGGSLTLMLERLKEIGDIHQAAPIQQEAVDPALDSDAKEISRLIHLGRSLMLQAGNTQDIADIDRAISIRQQALVLMPDHYIRRPLQIAILGTLSGQRFKQSGEILDIDMSISFLRQAADLLKGEDHHSDARIVFCNLGLSYRFRFQNYGEQEDILAAVAAFMASAKPLN